MSADSLSRFGRAGWRCDLDVMELIVFIADAAAALYFLFGVGVDDAPHLVANIVVFAVCSLFDSSLWHCLLDAFDIFAEADEDDAATTNCRKRRGSSDLLRWWRAATIVRLSSFDRCSGIANCQHNFQFSSLSLNFGSLWLWQEMKLKKRHTDTVNKSYIGWSYPYFLFWEFENYRNSWNGSRVGSSETGPRSQNCAGDDANSHKNGPSAISLPISLRKPRVFYRGGGDHNPLALAYTVQFK